MIPSLFFLEKIRRFSSLSFHFHCQKFVSNKKKNMFFNFGRKKVVPSQNQMAAFKLLVQYSSTPNTRSTLIWHNSRTQAHFV